MVWVILGPLAPAISADLGLSPAQKGLMVAVPTLAGALLRVVNGLLVDRNGPKRSGAISQAIGDGRAAFVMPSRSRGGRDVADDP